MKSDTKKIYAVTLTEEGLPEVQDQLVMRDGCLRGLYSNQTVGEKESLQRRPIHAMDGNMIYQHTQEHYCAIPPERITEAQYIDALEALPPENWGRQVIGGLAIETFAFMEYINFDITRVYAKINGEHWALQRPADTSRMAIFMDILHKTGRSEEEKKEFFA
jgi:hypothetical protein